MSENRYCYNCRFYKPYYIKGYKQFDRLDCGICGRTKENVEKHKGCEYFSYKYYARMSRKEAALAAITENVNVLSEIKQILEEDDEDAMEEFLIRMKQQKKKREKE